MADFKVEVLEVLGLENIPGADFIELAVIKGYRSVVKKDSVQSGDIVVYIPEGSIVPNDILTELDLVGKLNGKNKDRVKAARFQGCLSQGLVYKPTWIGECQLYDDVGERCGIVKYEQPIPTIMAGKVSSVLRGKLISYDIENIKRWPDVLQDMELVSFQEKAHGTLVQIAMIPDIPPEVSFNGCAITSKGIGAQGLCFLNVKDNKINLYIKTVEKVIEQLYGRLLEMPTIFTFTEKYPLYLFGEILGKGVQDLYYGHITPTFRLFDIYIGYPGSGRWLDYNEKLAFAEDYSELQLLPFLYVGPFTQEVLAIHTNGLEAVSGRKLHLREGIVIRPVIERTDSQLGRVILKSVSENYLLRTGNTTEYA